MGTAADVTGHYARGDLLRAILDGLAATGADKAELDPTISPQSTSSTSAAGRPPWS